MGNRKSDEKSTSTVLFHYGSRFGKVGRRNRQQAAGGFVHGTIGAAVGVLIIFHLTQLVAEGV